MTKAAPEHFEMAATAFTSTGKIIDSVLCEAFADILARESAGHSAALKEGAAAVKELNVIKNTFLRTIIGTHKEGDSR